MDLYIQNLPLEINHLALQEMFEPFGKVHLARVFPNKSSSSKGIGLVCMADKNAAKASLKALHKSYVSGVRIKVKKIPSWYYILN